MEADSLAQSVEMSAVPWPLLKLCFYMISNLQEMVLLSEIAREDLYHSLGKIILNHKCQGLFTLSCNHHLVLSSSLKCYDLDARPTDTEQMCHLLSHLYVHVHIGQTALFNCNTMGFSFLYETETAL